jgi:alkylhydroperoxidase family enzyme
VVIGKACGLTEEEIARVAAGPEASGWQPIEAALLRAVDELHADAFISDVTWADLEEHFDVPQLIDLVFAVGQYNLVSMALNTLGVQLDAGLEGFPKGRRARSDSRQ